MTEMVEHLVRVGVLNPQGEPTPALEVQEVPHVNSSPWRRPS
ncbi:hypothetical protein STIAU_1191 [Stigmatella aurantiaca DW4/3-1]|uniref:Uncharacterized protein n=1 Tax=Stigmatella aurantiaca (strain DW4/3-1) TaxID=378806 RepID=Q08YF0_STIAD|nr:hypothetical protein STIAU_1191 [Stigmatella aurantiaca DW4/3-1]